MRIRIWVYEAQKYLLSAWKLQASIGVFAVSLALCYSIRTGSWSAFARAGSIMTLMGGYMTFRGYLRGTTIPWLRDTGEADRCPFKQADTCQDKAIASGQDNLAMKIGIWFISIGTLIWGYGDTIF